MHRSPLSRRYHSKRLGLAFAILLALGVILFDARACRAREQLDSGVSVLQRRITELEQALDRCQKRLEIPTVSLTAHPEVEAASTKVGSGGKVDLDAVGLGGRVKEDAFLNQVQVLLYVRIILVVQNSRAPVRLMSET